MNEFDCQIHDALAAVGSIAETTINKLPEAAREQLRDQVAIGGQIQMRLVLAPHAQMALELVRASGPTLTLASIDFTPDIV